MPSFHSRPWDTRPRKAGHSGCQTARLSRNICVGFDAGMQLSSGGARWPCRLSDMSGSAPRDLDDWRQFGTGLVGLQAVERSPSLLAFRMDDRKQRIVIDRALPDGARFFGWEVADAAASTRWQPGWKRRRSRSPPSRRRWPTPTRPQPDFVSRSRRQSAGGILRRRDRRHAVHARPLDFRLPHRSARPRPCRADGRKHRPDDGVLSRCARLRAFRLHGQAVPRLLLSRQCAASQPCPDRDRPQRHASSDGGIVFARRCRPVLRYRA